MTGVSGATGPAGTSTAPPELFSKDVDPDAISVALGATTILQVAGVNQTWDAGANACFLGMWTAIANLPAPGGVGSQSGLRFEFSDGATVDYINTSGSSFNMSPANLGTTVSGSVGAGNAINNGKSIRKISLVGKNNSGTDPLSINFGNFSLRFVIVPVGTGSAL